MKADKLKAYKSHLTFILSVLDLINVAASNRALLELKQESLSRLASEASERLILLDGIVKGTQKGGNGHGR